MVYYLNEWNLNWIIFNKKIPTDRSDPNIVKLVSVLPTISWSGFYYMIQHSICNNFSIFCENFNLQTENIEKKEKEKKQNKNKTSTFYHSIR